MSSSCGNLSIAVIGCGRWGKNHVRVWSELGCLKVICDSDPNRLKEVHNSFPEAEIAEDVGSVFSRDDIDAVVIATPAVTHFPLAKQALESGKDVLVEKPMALTVKEGEQLVEIAQRHNLILMVGHVLEYHPAFLRLKELVMEGALGRIQYIYSHRLNLGQIRTEENVLWSFAPHDIALLLRLLGTMPEEVTCQGEAFLNHQVADVTLMTLRFPYKIMVHIFVSWLHPFKEHRFIVVGDKQMAVFDDTRPWTEKLTLYPHQIDWIGGQIPVAHNAEAIHVTLEEKEPLKAECEHFLECVQQRKKPLTDGESGVQVLKVLEAAQKSMEQKGWAVSLGQRDAEEGRGYFVHPTATVDPGAEIGEGTKIWHYSHVMSGAKIGRNCVLGQNVFIGRNVRIGDGVKIQNNVSVYEGVELEDYVFCGPSMVFTNVVNPRSEIERKSEFRKTLVKRGATLGANCTIICGVTIGRYAFIGAGAVVTKDVPDYALVVGVPARIVGWVCECGEKLVFNDGWATCHACGKKYKQPSVNQVVRVS